MQVLAIISILTSLLLIGISCIELSEVLREFETSQSEESAVSLPRLRRDETAYTIRIGVLATQVWKEYDQHKRRKKSHLLAGCGWLTHGACFHNLFRSHMQASLLQTRYINQLYFFDLAIHISLSNTNCISHLLWSAAEDADQLYSHFTFVNGLMLISTLFVDFNIVCRFQHCWNLCTGRGRGRERGGGETSSLDISLLPLTSSQLPNTSSQPPQTSSQLAHNHVLSW